MKTPRFLVAACVSLALAFTFSCSSDSSDDPVPALSSSSDDGDGSSSSGGGGMSGTFTDPRDSKTYEWVRIGGKVWLAKNLNFNAPGSKCGDSDSGMLSDDPSKCADYGRFYNWEAAMSACPSGFHLPSDDDWDELFDAVGGESVAGTKLKKASGWNEEGNGTDDFGFSALPGGYGGSDGSFNNAGYRGYWWSSSEYEYGSDDAYYRGMNYDYEYALRDVVNKTYLFSVRCVQELNKINPFSAKQNTLWRNTSLNEKRIHKVDS